MKYTVALEIKNCNVHFQVWSSQCEYFPEW